MEKFKNSLPEHLVVYLNEQKVTSLSHAAVLADEFVLTHKTVFGKPQFEGKPVSPPTSCPVSSQGPHQSNRECYKCHKMGHIVADCSVLRRKQQPSQFQRPPKGVGLIKKATRSVYTVPSVDSDPIRSDPVYDPFVFTGLVSLSGNQADQQPVQVLRDTGAAQSVILTDALPCSDKSYSGSHVMIQGIEMGMVPVPLHWVHLESALVTGFFRVGVQPALPVTGVTFILGNEIAGGKVLPVLEVLRCVHTAPYLAARGIGFQCIFNETRR